MAIDKELLDEINALAKKKKEEGLTETEIERQHKLRKKYLKQFRRGFNQVLENVDVVNEFEISKKDTDLEQINKLQDDDRILRIENQETQFIITYKFNEITQQEILKIIKS